jgi:ABC-type Fe3+/spermidine/putrescine transport system ATPase subunit
MHLKHHLGKSNPIVALARAMVFEPRILLMDEPLGALDRKLREQMQIQIMRLHHELGVSIGVSDRAGPAYTLL